MRSVFEKSAYWTGVVAFGLVAGLGIQFARAWVSPAQTPPDGNVGAPINTGAIDQVKQGIIRAVAGLQTPNLRVEPIDANGDNVISGDENPTGKVLAAVDESGDIAYAAGNGGGGSYTAWGTTSCASGWTVAYTGEGREFYVPGTGIGDSVCAKGNADIVFGEGRDRTEGIVVTYRNCAVCVK